jgi:hypothetical protein
MATAHDDLVKLVEDLPGVEVFWQSIPESFKHLTLGEARDLLEDSKMKLEKKKEIENVGS